MTAPNAPQHGQYADYVAVIAAKIDPTGGACHCWEIREGHWCDYCYDLGIQAVAALEVAGFTIIRSDSWRLRHDFDVAPHIDGAE